jgi:hypothetical protein
MTDDPVPMPRLTHRPGPVVAVVAAAVVGVGLLWFILSVVTGLIFHFMPGAPIVAAVWVRRSYGPDRPLAWNSLGVHVVGGVMVSLATGATLLAAGGSLDDGGQVAAVLLAGTVIAIWLGRRGSG